MLTEKQAAVIKKIASGMNVKTIAGEMKLSTKTVEFHKAAACRKLDLKSTAQIVHYGIARLGVPLLFAFLLLFSPAIKAANPSNLGNGTFAWDRSPDDLLNNGTIYRLYIGTNVTGGVLTSLTNAYTGTNVSVTLTNLAPAMWYLAVTASQGGLESAQSNILPYYVPAVPPRPPGKLFMIYMQATFNFTNFTDMGAFRGILNVYP